MRPVLRWCLPPQPGGAATGEITGLLLDWRRGNPQALEDLLPIVYRELRRLAAHCLRSESPSCSVESAELVNEAYLRLVRQELPEWNSRAHFFGVAARLMRQILVDHARAALAAKRGARQRTVALDDTAGPGVETDQDLVALDEALERLAEREPRQVRVVELRYFTGLSLEMAAEVLEVSRATVARDWRLARAFLYAELRTS